jgi:hypothetical protein
MTDGTAPAGDTGKDGDSPNADEGSSTGRVDGAGGQGDENAYRGVVGTFPYAFRASDSRLFRTYAAAGGLLTALVVVLFVLSLVVIVAGTVSATGGMFTFSRSFLLVVMLVVVVPLVAPVLFVARRHRRAEAAVAYDRALAGTGFLFILALYLGLVISAPESLADDAGSGPLGAVVGWLYSLPRSMGALPPLIAALSIYAAHRTVQ